MSKQELPKLPYGQGAFTWRDDSHTLLRYQKTVKLGEDERTYRLSVSGASVSECMDKMKKKERSLERDYVYESQDSAESPTAILGDAMRDWLKLTKYNSTKATTFDRNELTLVNQIIPFSVGKKQVEAVTSRNVTEHLLFLQNEALQGRGYSYSTVKKTYELLNGFFAYYYSSRLDDNPMNAVKPPVRQSDISEMSLEDANDSAAIEDIVLTDDEIAAFKDFVFQPPLSGSLGRSRHNVSLYFILLTCLRVGEAITLTWEDYNPSNKTLRVNKTTSRVKNRGEGDQKTRLVITKPKTATAIRTIPLSEKAIEALDEIRKRSKHTAPKDYIICTDTGERVTVQNLLKTLKGVLKATKLLTPQREKRFGLHYLRHTGISYYLRHGIPVEMVSKMGGHSNIDVTLRTYYHIIKEQDTQMRNMMDKI